MNEYNETGYTIENVEGYGEVELPVGMTNEEKAEAIYQGIQSGIIKPLAQEMPEAAPGPGMFTKGLESLKTGFEGIVEPVGMGLLRAGAGIGQALLPATEFFNPLAGEAFGGLGLTGKLEQGMKAAEEAYGAKYGGELLPETLAFGAEVLPFLAGGGATQLAKAPAFLRAAGQKFPQLASAASLPRRLLTQAADKFPKLTGAAGIFGKGAVAGAASAPITYDPTFERLGLEGSLERAAEAAPLGGLLGLGVGGLARAPQALRKAFGQTGTLTAEEAPELLRRLEGTETPLGDVLDSPALKRTLENIMQPVPFSGIPAKMQQLGTEIRQRGENIIKTITPAREQSVGEELKEALIKVNNKLENQKRALYKEVDNLADEFNIRVEPRKYQEQAKDLLDQTETTGIFGKLKDEDLKDFLEQAAEAKPGRVKDANIMISQLNDVGYGLDAEGKSFLAQKWKKLAQSLKDDLEDSMQFAGNPEEMKAAYDTAQKFFAQNIVPLRDPLIMKYTYGKKGDPDTLVRDFVKTGITDRPILLSKITKILEPEDRKLFGQNLLATAIEDEKLSPAKMVRLYKNREQRMKDQLFTKETQEKLNDYVTLVEKNDAALSAMANPPTGQQLKEMQALKLIAGASAVPSLAAMGATVPALGAILAARLGGKAMTSPQARRLLVEQYLKGKQPGFIQPGKVPSAAIGAGLPIISGTDTQGGMFDIPEFE
jgi:hypothetical protein